MLIDLADKLLTVAIVFTLLKLFPQKYCDVFPLSYVYDKKNASVNYLKTPLLKSNGVRKHSLRIKIMWLIVGTSAILSILSVAIGLVTYRQKIQDRYESITEGTVDLMVNAVDGDKIEEYLSLGDASAEYRETETYLNQVLAAMDDVTYMYVYQIKEDGCHVVFDLDTAELQGEDVGTVIPFDKSFEPYLPDLFAGNEIEPIVSNDQYGWLLTVYKPIRNGEGKCVAYAAADVDMQQLSTDSYVYFIRVAALLFGVSITIAIFALWYAETHIVEPINALMERSKNFAFADNNERETAYLQLQNIVKTGDEIEVLSDAMAKSAQEIIGYIGDIRQKAEVISKMQINTIHSFANMVESRDSATGDHIRRTAEYVRIIGEGVLNAGLYPELVNAEYVQRLTLSAPLHDIGKIGISDTILNKPGKLTEREFDIMKTHTTIGQSFIQSSLSGIEDGGYLAMASDMSAYHHEKWNGKGYPYGLSGEDIPLCARIMAVADVFDALLSKRSYKAPFSYEDAVSIIKEESGTHFDPNIVSIFLTKQNELQLV